MSPLHSLCLLTILAAATTAQTTQSPESRRIEDLEKRILQLEQRIRELEVKQAPAPTKPPEAAPAAAVPPPPAELPSTETRLPVSGYMDFHFNKERGLPGQLDFHRFVLLFGHSFSDRIKFWSELELEHAFVEGGEERGELELEQAYLDFLVKPYLNFRGGMILAPVGLINERHEPPAFHGVERPFVDTVILPSTWFDTGAGIFGDLGKGFRYKLYLMSPLDATLFSAEEGLRDGRQKGSRAVMQNPALTGRLEYHGLPRLSLGASFWRGRTGFNLVTVNPRVGVVEFDGRYSVWRLDFRGQIARVTLTRAGELNLALQRSTGVSPNIARSMRGFYWETAARVLPRRFPHEMAVFSRYENFDTQHRMPTGYQPLKQFDRSAWVTGLTYWPEPDVALKFDYTIVRSRSTIFDSIRSINLGIGWWF